MCEMELKHYVVQAYASPFRTAHTLARLKALWSQIRSREDTQM